MVLPVPALPIPTPPEPAENDATLTQVDASFVLKTLQGLRLIAEESPVAPSTTRRLRVLIRTGLLAIAFAASAAFGPGGAFGAGMNDPAERGGPAAHTPSAAVDASYQPLGSREAGSLEAGALEANVSPALYSLATLTGSRPYRELRRETSPSRRVGLFAHGEGFAPGQEVVRYDLQGGALLRIHTNWSLEGSYRWLDLDAERGRSDTGLGGPFLGLRMRF